ncbi:hypothetical protein BDW42DRAFT_5666 [Aspergillus taichungensis]|uniref:Tetratricopeptide repeat domain protein n=1 Tax=Aspergillus taichungensis TaxID=482145 RepID=A0A2J5HJQ8_9EURO|nr:hypothetical protein BDW42DRAFT_5666 [Aspergillus taichungensis]
MAWGLFTSDTAPCFVTGRTGNYQHPWIQMPVSDTFDQMELPQWNHPVCESPSLMMIFASLGDIHATRYQKTGRPADLKEAISATRIALSISAADDPLSPTLLNNLGSLLLRRHHVLGELDDLDLALYYTRQTLDFISVEDNRFPLVLATFGAVRATRYDEQDDFADLEVAISKIQESLELRPKDETLHISLFNNLGALLWRRYRLTGRPQELDESILSLSKALEGKSNSSTERVACLINCGFAFVQRYRLVEQLGDLDSALRHAQEAMHLDPGNHQLSVLLRGLDTFLERRRDHSLPQSAAKGPWLRMSAVLGFAALLAYSLLVSLFYWIGISPTILLTLTTLLGGILGKRGVDQLFRGRGNLAFSRSPFACVSITGGSKADGHVPKILPTPLIAVPLSSSLRRPRKLNDHREQPLKQHPAQKHQDRSTKHWRSLDVTGIDQDCRVNRGTYDDQRYVLPACQSTSKIQTSRRKSRTDITFAGAHVENHQKVFETARSEPGLSTKEASLLAQRVPPQEPSDFSTGAEDANTAYESDHETQPQLPSQVQVPEPPQRDTKNLAPVDRLKKQDESSPSPETKVRPLQDSEYPEHRIWHDVPSSGAKTANNRRTSIIYQGDTTHELGTNEGLAMGNVSGKQTQIVGHVRYEDTQSGHHDLLGGDRVQPTQFNQYTSSTISGAPEGISSSSIKSSPSQKSVSEDGVDSPFKILIPTVESISSDDDEREYQKEREVRFTGNQDSFSKASMEDGKSEHVDYAEEDERQSSEKWSVRSEHDGSENRARDLDRYSLRAEEEEVEHEAKKSLVNDSVRAYMEPLGLEM